MKDLRPLLVVPQWQGGAAGGLNTVDPPNMIGPYQLSDVRDWYPYRGSWRRRGGYAKFTSDAAGAVTIAGIFIHNQADGTKRIVAGHTGGKVEDITAGAWGADILTGLDTTSDAYMRFTSALDTMIVVNAHNRVQKATYSAGWTGGNLGGIGATYYPKDVKFLKGRVWVTGYTLNRNGALYSQAGTIETWSGTDSGEETFYTPNDASGMVGMGILRDYLVFFKRHSVGVLMGENDPEVWSIRPMGSAHGAVAARSIVDTQDGANGVYWISDEGPMRLTLGAFGNVENLGKPIRTAWDGTVWSWDSVTKANLPDCHGIYYAPRNEVWWYLLNGSGTSEIKLVYSIDNDALSVHTDYGYASCYGLDTSSNAVALMGDAAGYIYKADYGYQDSGSNFNDYIQFPLYDDRVLTNVKTYHSVIPLIHTTSVSATLSITGSVFYDNLTAAINADPHTVGATSNLRYFRNPLGIDTASGFIEGHGIQPKFTSIGNWGVQLYGFLIHREGKEE